MLVEHGGKEDLAHSFKLRVVIIYILILALIYNIRDGNNLFPSA